MRALLKVLVCCLVLVFCPGCGLPAAFYVWSSTKLARTMLEQEHEKEQDERLSELESSAIDPNQDLGNGVTDGNEF